MKDKRLFKNCKECGDKFLTYGRHKRFCCKTCCATYWRKQNCIGIPHYQRSSKYYYQLSDIEKAYYLESVRQEVMKI